MELNPMHLVLVLFCFGASLGLYLLSRVFRGLARQNGVMLIHGLLGGAGLCLLIFQCASETTSEVPYISLFFFIVAVFGGIFMVMWDKIMNRKMPRIFPVLHGSAALAGIVTLLLFMVRHNQF